MEIDYDNIDRRGLTPEGRARLERRRKYEAELLQRLEEDDVPLRQQLREIGLDMGLDDLGGYDRPLGEEVVGVLLNRLTASKHPISKELILRALCRSAEPFDGRPLQAIFESEASGEVVRWLILTLIASHLVHSIDEWIRVLLDSPPLRAELDRLGYFQSNKLANGKSGKHREEVGSHRALSDTSKLAETSTSIDLEHFRPLLECLQSAIAMTIEPAALTQRVSQLDVGDVLEEEATVFVTAAKSSVLFSAVLDDESTLDVYFRGEPDAINAIDEVLAEFLDERY